MPVKVKKVKNLSKILANEMLFGVEKRKSGS
jgi:hypothetical protein